MIVITHWTALPAELCVLAPGWEPLSGVVRYGHRSLEISVFYKGV